MSLTAITDPQFSSVVLPNRRPMPVGARFPRSWPDPTSSPEEMTVVQPALRVARVFPVGCRFPRRSMADAMAYLATVVPTTPPSARLRVLPVGARFPRRPRPTTQHTADLAPTILMAA